MAPHEQARGGHRLVFRARGTTVTALDGIDLDVRDGEFLVVVGPSGCGKSTLLDLVGGPATPTSGRILVDGREITGPGLDRGVVGWYKPVANLLNPLLEIFRNTAALALLPVFVLILGLAETSKIAIIAYACAWPILLNTISGVRTVDPLLIKSARSLGLRPLRRFQKVVLPAAVPTIFTGMPLLHLADHVMTRRRGHAHLSACRPRSDPSGDRPSSTRSYRSGGCAGCSVPGVAGRRGANIRAACLDRGTGTLRAGRIRR